MPIVRFEGRETELAAGETVLDGLLKAGHRVPHSCRAGACQTCLMRAVEGRPPEAARSGLNDALKAQGYFLACVARPEGDLVVDQGGAGLQRTRVRIEAIDRLGGDVLGVFLAPEAEFNYHPGQFLSLIRDDGLSRSYSIASLPDRDDRLELHVRVLPDGRMGRWLADVAQPGDPATIQGPSGHCFYVPGKPGQDLVLAGTGTGLAPLIGIVQDAIRQGHEAPMTLFHGALNPGGLYLDGRLRDLERQCPTFRYVPCCLNGDGRGDVELGHLAAILAGRFPSFAGRRVFLCGDPPMVQALRKQVFLKGAGIREIFADAFLVAPRDVG